MAMQNDAETQDTAVSVAAGPVSLSVSGVAHDPALYVTTPPWMIAAQKAVPAQEIRPKDSTPLTAVGEDHEAPL
jgi:hypothetical protein